MESLNTRWSMISQLLHHDRPEDLQASWQWFIARYRPVILALLRRRMTPEKAEQAAAEFWGYLYQSNVFSRAKRDHRFRSYLFGVVDRFAKAFGRGGKAQQGADGWEDQLGAAPSLEVDDEDTRLWAGHQIRLALEEVAAASMDQARAVAWFYGLHHPDSAARDKPAERLGATAIAERLQKTTANVHQLLTRGRERLRSILEREVRDTVADEVNFEDELLLLTTTAERQAPGLFPASK